MTDQKTGSCLVMTLWESEHAFQNAWSAVESVELEVVRAFGSTEKSKVEGYEVSYGSGQAMKRAA